MQPHEIVIGFFTTEQRHLMVRSAAWQAGAQLTDARGVVHDYAREPDVLHTAILTPQGAGAWTRGRASLWSSVAADRLQTALTLRLLITLPSSSSLATQRGLVVEFAEKYLLAHGRVVDYALHRPHRADARPHAHLLVTSRSFVGEHPPQRCADDLAALPAWRSRWEQLCSRAQHDTLTAHKTLPHDP